MATNQERNEISAGCRTQEQECLVVVVAASETHFVAESLITSTVTVSKMLGVGHQVKHFQPREFECDPEISLNLISQPRRSED